METFENIFFSTQNFYLLNINISRWHSIRAREIDKKPLQHSC